MHHLRRWEEYLTLVEFSYKKGYEESLNMSPFEALYGRSCNTPVNWNDPMNMILIMHEMLKEMEQEIKTIKRNLKVAKDRKKNHVDQNRVQKECWLKGA